MTTDAVRTVIALVWIALGFTFWGIGIHIVGVFWWTETALFLLLTHPRRYL